MENHFQTKHLIALGIVLIIIISLAYLPNFINPNYPPVPTALTGRVSEVKSDSILVSRSTEGKDEVFEFIITTETTFTKDVIVISASQLESGKSFAPETKVLPGQFSDLAKDMVIRIKSTGNLPKSDKAEATEINYTTYDYPL